MTFIDLVHAMGYECKIDVEFFIVHEVKNYYFKNLEFGTCFELAEKYRNAQVGYFNVPRKNKISVYCIVR